jgi:hypothetical protein
MCSFKMNQVDYIVSELDSDSKESPIVTKTIISSSPSQDWGQDETILVESDSEGSDGEGEEEQKSGVSRPISFKSNKSIDIEFESSPIMNRRLSMRTLSIYRKESPQVSELDAFFLNQLASIVNQFPSPPTKVYNFTQPIPAKSTVPIAQHLLSEGWSMISKFGRLVTSDNINESAATETPSFMPTRRTSKEAKSMGPSNWNLMRRPSQSRHSRTCIPDVAEEDYV